MPDISNLINMLNGLSKPNNSPTQEEHQIPQELQEQYPYGQFPLRYTKTGQEELRKHSENRYSSLPPKQPPQIENNNSFDLATLIPLIQLLSNKQHPKDMFRVLSKLLFKDNKDLAKLFESFPIKSQTITPKDNFPNTQKININSLKRVN